MFLELEISNTAIYISSKLKYSNVHKSSDMYACFHDV